MRIREATAADAGAVAAVRIRSWRVAYRGLVPDGHLDAMDVAENAARHRERLLNRDPSVTDLVAERDGTVIGWGCLGPYRTEGATATAPGHRADGEIYALYVDPDHFGTGAGRALMTAALDTAAAAGHHRVLLWVVRGNDRARRFYERAGFAPDGAEEPFEAAGELISEVRYCRAPGGS